MKRGVDLLTALLLGTTVFFVTVSNRVHSLTMGCTKCTPDGCKVQSGQWITSTGTSYVPTCVDFDGVPPGHCATTERQEKELWEPDPTYPTIAHDLGNCFMMICNAASPTENPCSNPWNAPTTNAASPRSSTQSVAADTCPLNKN